MKKNEHVVKDIVPGSIAEELEIEPGDILLKINDEVIEVKIIDNGLGIPKDKINKVFDKFYQCDESHKKTGSGLGLSITKRIIELLNGSINYESIEGKGTTVTITLPKYL